MLLEVLDQGSGFKIRAAAVVIRDGRVLMHRSATQDVWYLPGGTGEFGETARETLVRELREELGVEARVGRLLWMVEHFFELRSRRWHQLGWYFEAELPEDCDAVRLESWEAEQPEGTVIFRWVPIDDVGALVHLPGFLATALREPFGEPRHLIHRDVLA
jgi:8-oxo-dGTP pyrophosphatase MutT (NUDIX family)